MDSFPDKLIEMFERSTIPLSLADPSQPDVPLLSVNRAFEALTGYDRHEIVGLNCRFLQPPGGAGPVRERIRGFMADRTRGDDRFLIPNVTRHGRRFVTLLYITRLRDRDDRTYYLGSQFDVTNTAAVGADTYDRALATDLDDLRVLGGELGIVVLGTFRALASSASVIAQTRLNHL